MIKVSINVGFVITFDFYFLKTLVEMKNKKVFQNKN